MKNLLRLCCLPLGLLVLAQCLVAAGLTLLPHFNAGRNTLLFVVVPYAGMGAALWLTHRLLGLVGLRREQVNARFPGPCRQLEFMRLALPLACALLPPLTLVAWAGSGAYWAVQRAWHGAPTLPFAAQYAACMFAPSVLLAWIVTSTFLSGIALVNSYTRAPFVGWLGRCLLLAAGAAAFAISLPVLVFFSIDLINARTFVGVAVWAACILVYTLAVQPRRPAKLWDGDMPAYVGLVALCVLVVPGLANQLWAIEFDWMHLGLMFVVGLVTWYRLGWLAAILAVPCGLNLWWALCWLLCLPDSVPGLCAHCGAHTHTWRRQCPRCARPLQYQPLALVPRGLGAVRVSAVLAGVVACLIIYALARHGRLVEVEPMPRHVRVHCLAPYPLTNVVITLRKQVIGTNHVALTGTDFPQLDWHDRWTRPYHALAFFSDGVWLRPEISTVTRPGAVDVFCYVRPPAVNAAAHNIRRQLLLADYAWERVAPAASTMNDATLVELLVCFANRADTRISACIQAMFSNYWAALPAHAQAVRTAFYLAHWCGGSHKLHTGGASGIQSANVVPRAIMAAAPQCFAQDLRPSWNFFDQRWPADVVQMCFAPLAQGLGCVEALVSGVPAAQHMAQWYFQQKPKELEHALWYGIAIASRTGRIAPALQPLLAPYRHAATNTTATPREAMAIQTAYCLLRARIPEPVTAEDIVVLEQLPNGTNSHIPWLALVGVDLPLVWQAAQDQRWSRSMRMDDVLDFELVWPSQFTATNIAACLQSMTTQPLMSEDIAWLVAVLCHWHADESYLAAFTNQDLKSALGTALCCAGVSRDAVVRAITRAVCRRGDAQIEKVADALYSTPHRDVLACLDILAGMSTGTLHKTIVDYRDDLAALKATLPP